MPRVETRPLKGGGTRYFVRLRDPRRGKQTSEVFATQPEAEQFCRDVAERGPRWALDNLDLEAEQRAELTLDQWAEKHFAALTNVTDGTLVTYRRIYNRAWSPALGHMRLSTIDRIAVATAVKNVPGSDKTVKNAWGVLANMFKLAVQDGLIERSPCVGVKRAKRTTHEVREHRYLTPGEFEHLLENTPEHWRPLVWTLAGTGMRWGEAAALLVSDVDLNAGTVRIVKAEKWDSSKSTRLVGPTKTGKSRRTLYLPREVIEALLPLVAGRKRNERLFLPPNSAVLRHKTFYMDIWVKKCTVGLTEPRPRIHDLRHSHVAWLIAAGTPLPVIQARLGHEKITTTIDTYGHLLPDLQRAAADAASAVFAQMPSRSTNGSHRIAPDLERIALASGEPAKEAANVQHSPDAADQDAQLAHLEGGH